MIAHSYQTRAPLCNWALHHVQPPALPRDWPRRRSRRLASTAGDGCSPRAGRRFVWTRPTARFRPHRWQSSPESVRSRRKIARRQCSAGTRWNGVEGVTGWLELMGSVWRQELLDDDVGRRVEDCSISVAANVCRLRIAFTVKLH